MRLRNMPMLVHDPEETSSLNLPEDGNDAPHHHSKTDVKRLRSLAARHLRENMEEFLPFLLNQDTGETMTKGSLLNYLNTSCVFNEGELRNLVNWPLRPSFTMGPGCMSPLFQLFSVHQHFQILTFQYT